MARRRTIDLDRDLPARAAALDGRALVHVFGGCNADGAGCRPANDWCCKKCQQVILNPWLTKWTCGGV